MTPPLTHPTFAGELRDARARHTLADQIGLAVRAHRRELGLSRCAYAAHRGWPPTTLARLERAAGMLRLDDITQALGPTAYALVLTAEHAAAEAAGIASLRWSAPLSWSLLAEPPRHIA